MTKKMKPLSKKNSFINSQHQIKLMLTFQIKRTFLWCSNCLTIHNDESGVRGHMVAGFTTTYASSVYHH